MSRSSSRHFYVIDESGQLQDAYGLGIADARSKRAFISPTSVSKEVRACPYNLAQWLRKQLVNACRSRPPSEGESDEDYYSIVDQLSDKRSREATDFGTAIHDAIEHYPTTLYHPIYGGWVKQFDAWYKENVDQTLAIEERVADKDIGVAGKLDRRVVLKNGRQAVLDIKTQRVKDRVYFGDEWAKQLSFYATAIWKRDYLPERPACINLVIDSSAPAPIKAKEWSTQEILEAHHEFMVDTYLWSLANSHWPVGRWYLNYSKT